MWNTSEIQWQVKNVCCIQVVFVAKIVSWEADSIVQVDAHFVGENADRHISKCVNLFICYTYTYLFVREQKERHSLSALVKHYP